MKKISTIKIIILGALISFIASCELEEANINQNDLTEVPVNVLLPFNQEGFSSWLGNKPQVMAGIFMQYYKGIENQPQQVEQYRIEEGSYVLEYWNALYSSPMVNTKIMIDIAEKNGQYYYAGIGKVLLALDIGSATTLWGDMPFSEALQGSENMSPKYDSQKSIYEAIQKLLDNAIIDLQTDYEGLKPGEDDLFFGGQVNEWVKVAYALKARYYMHLTKKEDELGYNPAQMALNAIDNAMTSSSSDLIYQFGFSTTEQNPFFDFTKTLPYIVPGDSYTEKLNNTSDPRKTYFFKQRFGSLSVAGAYFSSASSPYYLMTYHELKFIEAEARLRLNTNDPEIQTALNIAITENMKSVSTGAIHDTIITAYISDQTQLSGNFETDLETIITQKYMALYTSIEPWTDYRRTGYPELTPNEGGDNIQNPGGEIPRRLAYPQFERLYNQNFPAHNPNLQDRFWWDQE